MRVFEGGIGCAAANFIPEAPSPNAAAPPARKFRRVLLGSPATGGQQAHPRNRRRRENSLKFVGICDSSAFIPVLTDIVIVWQKCGLKIPRSIQKRKASVAQTTGAD